MQMDEMAHRPEYHRMIAGATGSSRASGTIRGTRPIRSIPQFPTLV